jgi:hypothetical protein
MTLCLRHARAYSGHDELASVARIERSEIQGQPRSTIPHFASFNADYLLQHFAVKTLLRLRILMAGLSPSEALINESDSSPCAIGSRLTRAKLFATVS